MIDSLCDYPPRLNTLLLSPDLPEFFLVGIHTQPSSAYDEINALVDVYEEAVRYYGNANGIILGDFNADCSYLSQRRYDMLDLVTDPRFTWLLDNNVDTTTGNSNCAYDKCVCVCVCVCESGDSAKPGLWTGLDRGLDSGLDFGLWTHNGLDIWTRVLIARGQRSRQITQQQSFDVT